MKPLLPMIEFPISMFTRVGDELTCKVSEMGNRHLQPISSNGKSGAGFSVRLNGGGLIKFAVIDVEKDAGGDITMWHYKTLNVCPCPSCDKYRDKELTATIFND